MAGQGNSITLKRLLRAVRAALFGNRRERRRLRLELARMSAGLFGDHYLGDDFKLWRRDKQFLTSYARLSPHNPYSQERKYTLREFVRYTGGMEGAMAECGCYTGASAYFMADTAPDTPLYLFDSFAGLSPPGPEDEADSFSWEAGDMLSPESTLRRNLSGYRNVHILKGWIPDRFPEVAERTFRLVHIDVDLYEPTLECLRFFYPRLAPGGVILLDDYGFTTCPGAYRATNEFMAGKPEYVLHLPTGQGVIIRRHSPA